MPLKQLLSLRPTSTHAQDATAGSPAARRPTAIAGKLRVVGVDEGLLPPMHSHTAADLRMHAPSAGQRTLVHFASAHALSFSQLVVPPHWRARCAAAAVAALSASASTSARAPCIVAGRGCAAGGPVRRRARRVGVRARGGAAPAVGVARVSARLRPLIALNCDGTLQRGARGAAGRPQECAPGGGRRTHGASSLGVDALRTRHNQTAGHCPTRGARPDAAVGRSGGGARASPVIAATSAAARWMRGVHRE